MKTSLNDIRQIEKHLTGRGDAGDALVLEARLIVEPALRMNVMAQKKAYSLIRMYGRKKLRTDLEQIHEELFNDPAKKSFRDRIVQWFSH